MLVFNWKTFILSDYSYGNYVLWWSDFNIYSVQQQIAWAPSFFHDIAENMID